MDDQLPVCRHYTLALIRGCEAGRIAPMDCPGCSSYDPERIGGERTQHDLDRESVWSQNWTAE